MTQEQYFLMCEQMGWEPKDEEIPPELGSLPYEVQLAVIIFNTLPDRVEGMSGTWLGKDFSPIQFLMDIYEVDNAREVFDYILIIQKEYFSHYRQQQQMREAVSKAKR